MHQAEAFIPSSLSRAGRSRIHSSSRTCLSESRRPINSRYSDEGAKEEDRYWEEYPAGSKEEIELNEMSLPKDMDEYYDETSSIARYGDDDDYEEVIENNEDRYFDKYDDDYSDEEADPGNFWSNPSGGVDRPIPSRRRQGSLQQPRPRGYSAEGKRRPPARRSPIRMNGSSVPNPAKDFYERLFWYGFDADDTEGVGDKTVFGGTKGKFNGLSFKEASETSPYQGPNRQPRRRGDNEYYEDGYGIDDYGEGYYETPGDRPRSMKPPSDTPYPRADRAGRGDRQRRRTNRQQSNEFDDRFESENPGDWVSKSVSSWFTGSEDNDEDDDFDDRSSKRRRRKESSTFSPFNIVDRFFGVDRDEMQYKADIYNEKMGLGMKRRSSFRNGSRERTRRQTPRRPGYAYKYDEEDEEELNPIVDIGMDTPVEDASETVDVQNTEAEMPSMSTRKRKEKTWEERSLAVERVPPAGISAWGPSGEMPCDARTKAIMDALEDIQTARQKLERRLKKEALAKEEIMILKVDAELQRRKLRNSESDPFLLQEQLRQIEFEMDDASRELRRARTSTELARDQLETFEERHWALLRFYDPEKAGQQVEAALLELGEVEPAARLSDPNVSVKSTEANDSVDSA
ncbi:unnamed protein product [Cylindrotheca closterium]|uniref:Uncharacterized protein n=1 Tax=Cylindrotheca closterium TaxID=2856 RepID=A0AAD2CTY0_9STRA|nr:unnamed protein product [Cylindrotheca closterium]